MGYLPQMDKIPPYWLSRKSDWLDAQMCPTVNWDEAAFVYEAGEYVRIVKPGDAYDQMRALADRWG